ncbi:MAG: T9SS type A sorting domain-containing protein [bacterium]
MKPKFTSIATMLLAGTFILRSAFADEKDNKKEAPKAKVGNFTISTQALGRFSSVPQKNKDQSTMNYYADFALWVGAVTDQGTIHVTSGDRPTKDKSVEWIPVPKSWKENVESSISEAKTADNGQFTDAFESDGHTPLGLEVSVTSYSFEDKGYALFDYELTLKEGYTNLKNLYIGFQSDVDVPNPQGKLTPDDDRLGFTPNGKGIYITNEEGKNESSALLGIGLLNADRAILSWWTRETDPANDRTRYDLLQGKGCHPNNPNKADDYRFMISSGPYALNVGEAIRFTVAVLQANSAEAFSAQAEEANLLASQNLQGEGLAKGRAPDGESILAGSSLPTTFKLYPCFPNPFNSQVQITFDLPESGKVDAVVYDILGRPVKTLFSSTKPAGTHTLTWNGSNDSGAEVVSGVYLLILQTGATRSQQKLVLMK